MNPHHPSPLRGYFYSGSCVTVLIWPREAKRVHGNNRKHSRHKFDRASLSHAPTMHPRKISDEYSDKKKEFLPTEISTGSIEKPRGGHERAHEEAARSMQRGKEEDLLLKAPFLSVSHGFYSHSLLLKSVLVSFM